MTKFPQGTDPFSPESKVVMAVGPLTASGVPLAGRTTFSHLSTYTTDHLVVDSHCGGMIGAKLKLAGRDGLIIEGASDKPVYIKILDDKITIEDAILRLGHGHPRNHRSHLPQGWQQVLRCSHRPRWRKLASLRMPH